MILLQMIGSVKIADIQFMEDILTIWNKKNIINQPKMLKENG